VDKYLIEIVKPSFINTRETKQTGLHFNSRAETKALMKYILFSNAGLDLEFAFKM